MPTPGSNRILIWTQGVEQIKTTWLLMPKNQDQIFGTFQVLGAKKYNPELYSLLDLDYVRTQTLVTHSNVVDDHVIMQSMWTLY